ncbi:uncharacterized protein LOC111130113 isoform X2 [Crassostrea virginica]
MEKSELTSDNEPTPDHEEVPVTHQKTDRGPGSRHKKSKKKRKHSDYDALAECRRMFRMEMLQLGKELFQFRQMCQQEICKYKDLLNNKNSDNLDGNIDAKNGYISLLGGTSVEQYWKTKLDSLQADMTFLEKKQAQLDREQQMVDKEDELSKRLVSIENYEREIEELEAVLDKRQTRCVKRQQSLQEMEEELDHQRVEFENNKQQLEDAQEKADPSVTARKHWEIAKRGILETQSVLESTVQKYRAELASASSNITGKDILINKLDQQVKSLHEQLEQKDRKIRNLESRLVFAIEESQKSPSKPSPSGQCDSANSSPLRRPESQQSLSTSTEFSPTRSTSHGESNSSHLSYRKSKRGEHHSRKISDTASIRHPMRLSVDHGDDRFQMVKSPLPDKSNACSVM